MPAGTRPFRSVLYIPGSNARALEKAKTLPVDAIIFDLEDAVSVEEKSAARERLASVLDDGGFGRRSCLVRINGLDTPWWRDDLEAFEQVPVDGVVLPKVNRAADIDALAPYLPNVPVWAMMETPLGILNAVDIAMHQRLEGFILGTNDLAKDLGCRGRPDRLPLMISLQTCLVSAKASGIVCVDGVFNAFKDETGLRQECEQGRDLGFDGKTLIHPAQVAVANEAFAPSEDELNLARRHIEAYDAAVAEGKGIAVVDGQIVENLHVETAKALLQKTEQIEAMNAE